MILKNFLFQFNQLLQVFACHQRHLLHVVRNFFKLIFMRLLYYELEFFKG
jgi:hypothetical protein